MCIYVMSSAVEPEELILVFLNAGRLQNEEEQKAASLFRKIETNDRAEQGEILFLIRLTLSSKCGNSS